MQKLCIECNHIGKEIRTKYFFLVLPIIIILIGLEFILGYIGNLNYFLSFIETSFLVAIASLIFILFGFYSLMIFLSNPEECPDCKQKRTMIPLDTPKAQALIKERNLTIPEKTQQQASIPKTSQ